MKNRIDVMIIGAQKAGTTSLLRYFGEHPECVSHPQKEFAFFLDSEEYSKGYDAAYDKYFKSRSAKADSLLIAKSATLYTSENAIRRLHEHNPACEIVIILRNPVERTYSSFLMEKNSGSLKFEFSEIKNIIQHKSGWEYEVFIDFGIYEKHLRTVLNYFPANQVTVILFDELKENPKAVCKNIFLKLKIDSKYSPNVKVKHNVTRKTWSRNYAATVRRMLGKHSYLRKFASVFISTHRFYKYGNAIRDLNKTNERHFPMDADTKVVLHAFFAPFNKELSQLLKIDLSSWEDRSLNKTDD
jgi:hypothetical protein